MKLLDWDHNWDDPTDAMASLNDPVAQPYVAGVAWHCYAGDVSTQTTAHNAYPNKETYVTECSGGAWAPVWADNLLWNVTTLVMNGTRDWAKGVLLWNLALDENSGPHNGGLQQLPWGGHHQLRQRSGDAQCRVLRARPRQPFCTPRCAAYRLQHRRQRPAERGVSQLG